MALNIFIIIACYLLGVVAALAILAKINDGSVDDIPVGITVFSWLVILIIIAFALFYITASNIKKPFMSLYNWFYKEFHK